jgi:transposase
VGGSDRWGDWDRRRPKSPLGASIGYALRNWVALTRYTEDGRLKIDNSGAEQALRPIVLGRKNWLFAGSEAAAHRTAILCSLVQTCKHLQINPFVYLRDILERVSTHPARLVLELTPREWRQLPGGRRCMVCCLNESLLPRNPSWSSWVSAEIP